MKSLLLDFTQAEPYHEVCAHDTRRLVKETRRGAYYQEYDGRFRYIPCCIVCGEDCIEVDDLTREEDDVHIVTAEEADGIIGQFADAGDRICDNCLQEILHGAD